MPESLCWRGVSVLVVVSALLVLGAATALAGGSDRQRGFAAAQRKAGNPLDLVWISDSHGWGVAPLYARRIKEDLGVAVRVHDKWEGNLAAATVLERLRAPGHPWLRLIRDAEVIVVAGNPFGLGIKNVERSACYGGPRPLPLGAEQWAPWIRTLKAIYARIFELRKGKPVVLRTETDYMPTLYQGPVLPPGKSWQEAGVLIACTRLAESANAAVRRAAKAYGVAVADVYTAFNGKTHLEDPIAKGYIQPDNIHPNDAGRAVAADTFADLGYKKVKPPR